MRVPLNWAGTSTRGCFPLREHIPAERGDHSAVKHQSLLPAAGFKQERKPEPVFVFLSWHLLEVFW